MFGCSKKEVDQRSVVEELFRNPPKKRKVNDLCIDDIVYVQEQLCDMASRDESLKKFPYPVQTNSSRTATVVGIDEMCTTIIVQYHSKGTTASVARRNVLKVGYVANTSFVD